MDWLEWVLIAGLGVFGLSAAWMLLFAFLSWLRETLNTYLP